MSPSYYNESCSKCPDNLDKDLQAIQPLMSAKPLVDLVKPQPLMSATPLTNFSNSYDSKPSRTIERLQMFLQNRTTMSHEHEQQSTTNDYSSTSYRINQSPNSKNSQWSSSNHSSRVTTDTQNQNNSRFTNNDAEKLLAYIEHFRN